MNCHWSFILCLLSFIIRSQFCPQIDDFCPILGAATILTDLAEGCAAKAETFKKCQNLTELCHKLVCLSSTDSNISID